jgi:hypothetical protein
MNKISGECLLIGDVAGQYEALMSLLKSCPDVLPVSVGDMIDRGHDSKKVVDHFRDHGKRLKGNHEHMCVDFIQDRRYYGGGIWFSNGGEATVESYLGESLNDLESKFWEEYEDGPAQDFNNEIREKLKATGLDKELDDLPLYFELDGGGIVTHAPIRAGLTLETVCELGVRGFTSFSKAEAKADQSVIWNRYPPSKMEGKYQIFGHNSMWGHCFMKHDDDGDKFKEPWGVCLDDSRAMRLTAMHWPSKKIYQEVF